MGRGLDPAFRMTTEALPLLRKAARDRYRPGAMADRAWRTVRHTLAVAEQLPRDVSRLLRNARRGRLHAGRLRGGLLLVRAIWRSGRGRDHDRDV